MPNAISAPAFLSERILLRDLFDAALDAISPERCMRSVIYPKPAGRIEIIALGKAAAAMAKQCCDQLGQEVSGLVITPAGHALPPGALPPAIRTIEAGHPLPDSQSVIAAEAALQIARGLGPRDLLIALISGGGSALMAMPAQGVSLEQKQELTSRLLRSGATIEEINCVRKHLSAIKGGRLSVAAAPARTVTYLISDIPGDNPSFVASGPTIADQSSLQDAREVLQRYAIPVPEAIQHALDNPANETPSADFLGIAGNEVHLLAKAKDALNAAAKLAQERGFEPLLLGDSLEAEARFLGAAHAALAKRLAGEGKRVAIISGGETTVTVSNPNGRGGRNLEYLAGLAQALDGAPGISAIACDTDGIDGTEDNAGAIITPDTHKRLAEAGLSIQAALEQNRCYDLFDAIGDLVITGPTRTNVNDFRAILVDPG